MTPPPDISTLNTAPLHALFAAMAARVLAYMNSGASLYNKALRARRLAQLGRLLLSMERYNRDVVLKTSMLSCPQWRRRVIYDLGGWPALWRWQARHMAAARGDSGHQSPEWWTAQTCAAAPARANAAAPRGRAPVTTDRLGQFRWAVIPRGQIEARRPNSAAR